MRMGIYNEASGGALGGCEWTIAYLADAARSAGYSVEVVHHQPWLQPQDLEAFAGISLDGVSFRYVATRPERWGASWLPWRRLDEARQGGQEVSTGYDVFVALVHGVPPFNHSPRGILHVLFPMMHRVGVPALSSNLRGQARALYTRWEWTARLSSYEILTANSRYTATWCRKLWGIDPAVLYPPVDVTFPTRVKTRSIVTVGRFTRTGHAKRQDVLLSAFGRIAGACAAASFTALGSLSAYPDDEAFFAELELEAKGSAVRLLSNASRNAVVEALAEAAVYWHAAGYGEPADAHPERMEHFGISTVEAMAAGCVPVVINRGGQPEIVEHGVSGFVWETVDELIAHTTRLLEDDALRERMSAAARVRAQAFSIQSFAGQVAAMLRGADAPGALGAIHQPEATS
jgi:glycosyltransferase involved in cell wall biosynthesis